MIFRVEVAIRAGKTSASGKRVEPCVPAVLFGLFTQRPVIFCVTRVARGTGKGPITTQDLEPWRASENHRSRG